MASKNLKRAVHEDIARAHVTQGDAHSSKKPRFDHRNPSTLAPEEAPDEDTILELDEIGKGGVQAKRNAVRLEGYESDSSDENFDSRAEAKADEAQRGKRPHDKSADEEANDMFADLEEDLEGADEEEDPAREGKKQKKEVRFMNEHEIEGQVTHSKAGGHVSADFTLNNKPSKQSREVESSSDESGDDEERDRLGDEVDEELGAGSKKKHAPKLDAFNMRNENQEGRFDEMGNFVRNAADPFAVYDSWMDGSSKADMRRAREAQERRENDRRRKDMVDDVQSTGDLLSTLIRQLQEDETILEALARLAPTKTKQKQKPKWHKNKRKDSTSMDVETTAPDDSEEKTRKEAIEAITGAADQLLTRGQPEVYEAERALLIRQYRRETGEDWVHDGREGQNKHTNAGRSEWEYRWADGRDGGAMHGPYEGSTMAAWNDAGYFGEGVEFRALGRTGWSKSVDFV